LTGTPFVNRPSDIHSLLAFLGAEPLSDKGLFTRMIVQPIMEAKEIGLSRIRTMMSHLALRRTKVLVDSTIQLVPKEVVVRHLEFPEGFHQSTHEILYETARAAFTALLRSGSQKVFQNFYAFLVLVLRVRQSCCSGYLCPEECLLLAEGVHRQIQSGEVDLDAVEGEELLKKLLNALKGLEETTEYDKECAVCCNELEEETAVVLRSCQHVICESCLNQIQNHLCPFCRKSYDPSDMIKKSVAEEAAKKKNGRKRTKAKKAQPKVDDNGGEIPPKVQALLDAIAEMEPDEKGVVFSQWTSFLDIIQSALEREGHSTTRIDGSMNAFERINAMEAFSSDDDPRFILCSLHACSTGITLTRGNICFMMDAWYVFMCVRSFMIQRGGVILTPVLCLLLLSFKKRWNGAIEAQAMVRTFV
jgi:DNA repair protein RAD5